MKIHWVNIWSSFAAEGAGDGRRGVGDGDGGRLLEVHCSCCDTFLGVKDEGGVFHLFHVIPAAA